MKQGNHWDDHLLDARRENARFLLEMGEPLDRIAKRLGVTLDSLEKLLERHKT
jgi:hypothetical protein